MSLWVCALQPRGGGLWAQQGCRGHQQAEGREEEDMAAPLLPEAMST